MIFIIFVVNFFIVDSSEAQSQQYQRSKKVKTTKKYQKNKKVDIKEIEQQFWAPKDKEFQVVQNRRYKKEKRFFASVNGGLLLNDSYSKGSQINVSGGYFFDEHKGVELTYSDYNLKNNKITDQFINRYGTLPDHNKMNRYIGASFVWMPIYAKLSLLDKKIIYFDMALSAGMGMTWYDHQVQGASGGSSIADVEADSPAFTFNLDLSQHFYLNNRIALRFDVRTHFFKETVKSFKNTSPEFDNSKTSTSTTIGLVYFF